MSCLYKRNVSKSNASLSCTPPNMSHPPLSRLTIYKTVRIPTPKCAIQQKKGKRTTTVQMIQKTSSRRFFFSYPCEQLHLDTLLPTLAMLQTTDSNGLSQPTPFIMYKIVNLNKPQAEKLPQLSNLTTPSHLHGNKAKGQLSMTVGSSMAPYDRAHST